MRSYIKDNKFPTRLFLILIGVFFVDAALFNTHGYSSGRLFSIFIVILALFLNIEKTYYLAIFCFPFTSILKFSESGFSIIPVIYLITIFKLAILRNPKLKIIPLIAFILLIVVQLLSTFLYQTSLSGVISFLLSCFFVLYSISYFSTDKKCNRVMLKNAGLFLAVAVALNILLSDAFPNIAYIVSADKQELLVAGDRFGALFVEPNEFGQVVLVAIGFLIATFSSYKTRSGKIGIIAIALYLGINGVRSNSKSYVLTLLGLLCVLMLIYLIRFFKSKKTASHLMLFVVMLLLGVVAGYLLIVDVIIPVFEFRSEKADVLTGRGDIWKLYIDALLQRIDVFLIGCGAGGVTKVLRLVGASSSQVPHNFYLEYIIQFGFIGLVLVLMSWSETLKMMYRKSIWFWIPALAFLVTAFGISANSNDCVFITILLLAMPLELSPNAENAQNTIE